MKNNNESQFLTSLFSKFNKSNIRYCVLRNYDGLPLSTKGSDIDILVDKKEVEAFISILNLITTQNDGRILVFYRSGDFYRLCYCNPSYADGWGVQFDLHTDEIYKGIAYYDKELLLNRVNLHNEIPVLNGNDAMVLALLKESLSNGVSRKGYLEKAAASYRKNSAQYNEVFEQYYGVTIAKAWNLFLLKSAGADNLRVLAKKTRVALLRKAFFDSPIKTFIYKVKYHSDRFRRIVAPIGYSVVFLGTDGSGKTTIIKSITPLLEAALHTKLNYEHMRPNLFPSIAQLLGKKAGNGETVENPHDSKPSGFVGSLIRLSYYSLDYIFGYWFKIYPQMIKRPCLFIFDRYYYDYLIDPYRSRISLSKRFIKVFSALLPEPDLIVCLGAEPELIHERKPELKFDEVKRQVKELKEFYISKNNAVWIDTGGEIEESVNNVLEAVTGSMSQRYMGKL